MKRPYLVLLLCLVPLLSMLANCQQTSMPVSALTYTRYPSLEPMNVILVKVADVPSGMFDAVASGSALPGWNCLSTTFYRVAEVDDSGKDKKEIEVIQIVSEGTLPDGERFTGCDGSGQPGTIDLVLGNRFDVKGKLRVYMYADAQKTRLLASSDGKLAFPSDRIFTFSATPQAAPGEALNNGQKRYVNQLALNIGDTNLFPGLPVNLYAKTKDLFSTDGKDSKSAFQGTFGLQKGVFNRWYAPVYIEQGVQGNQTASNLSTITNLGITTLAPWSHTATLLNNRVISVPLPPDLNLINQYTHRINQLVAAKSKPLAVNDFSVNPSLSWKSITVPATCRAIAWLNRAGDKADMKGYCLGTELNLGLWYLPLDLTASKSQRAEGYGDVSILVPLLGFSFAKGLFPYITSNDPSKMQIRIKYEDSVNAANNYARTRQWTYGLELIK